jgi:hypothetical protein
VLGAAEHEVRLRGCVVMLIRSDSFQAPTFHQRCGYGLAWQRNDSPPGFRQCDLVERFEAAG